MGLDGLPGAPGLPGRMGEKVSYLNVNLSFINDSSHYIRENQVMQVVLVVS